jgi:hypothetical protein
MQHKSTQVQQQLLLATPQHWRCPQSTGPPQPHQQHQGCLGQQPQQGWTLRPLLLLLLLVMQCRRHLQLVQQPFRRLLLLRLLPLLMWLT